MQLTGNKGEWSEIYTLFKLLGDRVVYAGDQNMNKIEDLLYPIVKIIRKEDERLLDYVVEERSIVIVSGDNEELLRLPCSVFLEEATNLLAEIRSHESSFSVAPTQEFMDKIYCHKLKAKSSDKTDIRIVLHDIRTKLNSEMGFSIKSQLGGDSTLLNASKATNFVFTVEGADFSDEEISLINAINPKKNKVILRYDAIKEKGAHLMFSHVDHAVFDRNLRMLDGDMQHLMACMLLEQLESHVSTFPEIIEALSQKNPLHISDESPKEIYIYKAKHLLTSSALGMMPAEKWTGVYDANGGYLVVRKDGEIVCYHFYDRNRFEDYLFSNAYLERASVSRHQYASLYRDGDKVCFKLNLQVRLK